MAGRKVFNEQDARRCLAAVKSSRVDLGTWARAHGVDGRGSGRDRDPVRPRAIRAAHR